MSIEFMTRLSGKPDNVLAAILDQSQDCIKLVSTSGELEYMNANGQRAMGIANFDSVSGQPWWSMWPEESSERVERAVHQACLGHTTRFEGFCPTASGESRWWDVSVSPVRDEQGTISHVLATSRDITPSVNERLYERRLREEAEGKARHSEDVAREMRHRLKNLLAVVSAVAKMVARYSKDVSSFSASFDDKMTSLARAQDLIASRHGTSSGVAEAVTRALDASGAGERIKVGKMPDAALSDQAVQQLALVLGELQTNALKHGAHVHEAGTVKLTADEAEKHVSFHWVEHAPDAPGAPEREGAGIVLIKRLGTVPGAASSIDWTESGLAVTFHLPIR